MALGAFAPMPLRLGGTAEDGISAAQYMRLCADLASAMRVAPFATIVINQNDNDPKIVSYAGRNGVGTLDRPTVQWVASISRTRITWPYNWQDETGVVHPIRLRSARGSISGSAGFMRIDDITVGNQLDVAPVSRTLVGLYDKTFFLRVY